MSETPETVTAPDSAAPAAAPSRSRTALTVAVVAVAALAGVGAGVLAGPRIAGAAPSSTADHATAAETTDAGHDDGSVTFDNIIVNPAGSRGMRYVMLSVVIRFPGKELEAKLREREAEARDAVIGVIESRSLEQLTRPGGRDSLKVAIAERVGALAGMRVRVFLPQFVIQ